MTKLENIIIKVQEGNTRQTEVLIAQLLKENYSPENILRKGLIAGIMEMEKKFRKNEILDSEFTLAERALKAGLDILRPIFSERQNSFAGTVITGTLEGDIRETEKDITSCLMQSMGLKVIDLGISVSSIRFVEAAIEEMAQIIACTTTLTIFLPLMKSLVQATGQANIRGKTKILLSGAPVTEWFCKSIDADMYAPDPLQAAKIAAEYCRKIKN